MFMSSILEFYVNGQKISDEKVDPEWTLLQYLRNKLEITGTKLGCGEGGCGACTVMLSRYDRNKKKILHFAINACLTPICSVHGTAITTIEGIGSIREGLHPIQETIAKNHGSQCGFCTPGIVMSMYSLLRNDTKPSMEKVCTALQGNLCRCTGYRPILDSFKKFTNESDSTSTISISNGFCEKGQNCCKIKENGKNPFKDGVQNGFETNSRENGGSSSIKDVIFPPELQLNDDYDCFNLTFVGERVTWYRPTTLEQVLEMKDAYPEAKIIFGNTEAGVEAKFKGIVHSVIIHPNKVPDMKDVAYSQYGVRFGVGLSLSEMEEIIIQQISIQPKFKTRIFEAILEILQLFGGVQVRNVASIGGNILTGSPISDLNPIFMASHAELEVHSKDEIRFISMDDTFFTDYKTNILTPNEVLTSIFIPYTRACEYFFVFKQSKRREDDIAIVNAAMRVKFHPETDVIKNIYLAFGGMDKITKMCELTSTHLIGRSWHEDFIQEACGYLVQDLNLAPNAPGGMIQYRKALSCSFFYKFYVKVAYKLWKDFKIIYREKPFPKSLESITQSMVKEPLKSSQFYEISQLQQGEFDPIGQPLVHMSGLKQATGEAQYVDDISRYSNELYMAFVKSTRANAKILGINYSKALELDGVCDFISASDIPKGGQNLFGILTYDEQVFATDRVTCCGHIIGVILARNQNLAQRAAKLVEIQYEELSPVILTIDDAIRENSYFEGQTQVIDCGDLDKGFEESDGILEGEFRIGGQDHFYMETQVGLAIPKEDGEFEIFSSTQNLNEMQIHVSQVLGIPLNKIMIRTKRVGGGFGGKETRTLLLILPLAVAAYKSQKPIRCMLDRDEDMEIFGGRHPFLCKYKVGFCKSSGKINAMKLDYFANCGNTLDVSNFVMQRALFSADNSYKIPNISITGYLCKTNLPSNTAFRGFGSPQAMLAIENILDLISNEISSDPVKIRQMHLYQEGESTHFNQILTNCTILKCWNECLENSKYYESLENVEKFNRENRWRKRGLAIIPTKFGIGYIAKFLNQGSALVNVYTDGSVLLYQGGVEMGQGLHSKMTQVASRVLQISTEKIKILENSTNIIPNASSTGASLGSDLYGPAVIDACEKINERLKPYKKLNPKGSWEDWVKAAYFDRVSLSATGYYKVPDIGYNFESKSGNAFNYFCYGVGFSEVEIDCLTGDHQVRRTEIVMDVGESLNPAIDIGQIEGAFIQGYGLFTMEELHYSPQGFLRTKTPGFYKIPGFGDIPSEFNVSLLRGASNPRAVYSSKAVGEPPLFLASSIFFAIKNAIRSVRKENGIGGSFQFDSPATAERIRLACEDQFIKMFPSDSDPDPENKPENPWLVLAS